jgi:hypothetical protein
MVNQRKRKKEISCLEKKGIITEETSSMLTHAMEFYKNLFGEECKENIKLGDDFWAEDEKFLRKRMKLLKLISLRKKLVKQSLSHILKELLGQMDSPSFSIKDSGL